MNCNKDQHMFVKKVYEKEVTEAKKTFNATIADANLRTLDSCDIFVSCEKSPLMQSLESTKSLRGFFKFLGEGNLSQENDEDPEDLSCIIIRPVCV